MKFVFHSLFFCVIVTYGLASPDPSITIADQILRRHERSVGSEQDTASSGDKITSTDLCPNEIQFDEFANDFGVCMENTVLAFLDTYDFGWSQVEHDRATCNKYKDQIKCYTEGGPRGLRCFDAETIKQKKLGFLHDLREELKNGTSSNSENVINSCSIFANFEQEFLHFYTGCSACCSLDGYTQKLAENGNCYNEIIATADQRREIAFKLGRLGTTFLYKAECYLKRDWETKCSPIIFPCLSNQKKQAVMNRDIRTFANNEKKIRDAGLDFTYAETCRTFF